jgi:hypothetical protein
MSELTLPPGYRRLAAVVSEHGLEQARAKLLSGDLMAFRLNLDSGKLHPIEATVWGLSLGDAWLRNADWSTHRGAGSISFYTVVVRIPEKSQRPGKHGGGAPSKYDWEAAAIAVCVNKIGSKAPPKRLATFEKYISEYFAETGSGDLPSPSLIRTHAKLILAAYEKARN